MLTGNAPCSKCKRHIYDIRLTGNKEPAEDGGTWWDAEPDQLCPECGEPLRYMHEPRPLSQDEQQQLSILFEEVMAITWG